MARLLVALAVLACACAPDGAAAPEPTPRPTIPAVVETTPSAPETLRPSVSVAPPPAGCATGFAVQSGTIVVRVSERIGPIPVHEAVIEGDTVAGGFVVSGGGKFDACSAIVADLRRLRSTDSVPGEDVRNRDVHIHEEFLETELFPHAVLSLAAITGVPEPFPASGQWSAKISGDLTLHGKTNPVQWNVSATRDGAALSATATTEIGFDEYAIFRPGQVLSLDERIKIEVRIQARSR